MQNELQEVVRNWNRFVTTLKRLEAQWGKHLDGLSQVNVELLPLDLQRHLSQTFAKGDFLYLLPEITTYVRLCGGVQELFVKEPAKEKEVAANDS